MESISLRNYRMIVSLYENLYILPSRHVDSPRERKLGGKIGLDAEAAQPEIFPDFGLSLSLRFAAVPYRPGAEIYNLSESIYLVVFGHVRSYILIICRDSRAILDIPRDLSLFVCRRD